VLGGHHLVGPRADDAVRGQAVGLLEGDGGFLGRLVEVAGDLQPGVHHRVELLLPVLHPLAVAAQPQVIRMVPAAVATAGVAARVGRGRRLGDLHLAVRADGGRGAGRGVHHRDVADVVAVVVTVRGVVAVTRVVAAAGTLVVLVVGADRGFDCGINFDVADHVRLRFTFTSAMIRGAGRRVHPLSG